MVAVELIHLFLEHAEQVVQRFGQRGAGEDRSLEHRIRKVAHHGDLQHSHDLATLDAQDGAAQDLAALGIHEHFHHAVWLILCGWHSL